ncbi:MAG: hypothetical protein LQ349_004987 [Xanthoria aureola]|nr:MAG: hypothetical protein LQ349_004987 [Xanthoria aureola]
MSSPAWQCDETQPRCVNCATADAQCNYLASAKPAPSPSGSDPSRLAPSPAFSNTDDPNGTAAVSIPSTVSGDRIGSTWDILDMELLHHWCTQTYKSMTDVPEQQLLWQTTAVTIGFTNPFLLNELLAIAALHMAICRPERETVWHTRATELQSLALTGFNTMAQQVDESNCVVVLLFSALVGTHLLGDRSRIRALASRSDYLDHLVSCVNLMRSVRGLVLKNHTAFLLQSSVKALMITRNPIPPYEGVPSECRKLTALITESDLGPSSIEAYGAAIDRLFWLFDLAGVPSKPHDTPRFVFAWPVQLTDEYTSLLNQRRPEALIILAYYGVILHFYRDAWCIGDSGACMIRAIDAQLGSYWSQWLQWPMKVIASS